jgi:hypothetical protein
MIADKIGPHHLERKAILYVRQSSAHQVLHNRESRTLQYAMRVICYPSLDRRELEFSGLCHAGGLDAPAGVMRETGGLLPMAPCGRSWL